MVDESDVVITLTLPWPPTANTYWRRNGNRYFISPKGIAYRNEVYFECFKYQESELYNKQLQLFICAFPPDRRRRDLDNLLKATQDALQYCKIYKDDSQIDCLFVKRMPDLGGHLLVKISEKN